MGLTQTCPETVDLYDHLQGAHSPGARLPDAPSLDAHLADCSRCREALDSLRVALDVEGRAFAPPSELEVERALQSVRARGQARVRRPWRSTAVVFCAAAILLVLLLPSAFVADPVCTRPATSGGMNNVGVSNPRNVEAPSGIVEVNVPLEIRAIDSGASVGSDMGYRAARAPGNK